MTRALILALIVAPTFLMAQEQPQPSLTYNENKSNLVNPSRFEWTFGSDVSFVEVHEPTDPAAVATVTFRNAQVHTQDEEFTLTFNDIEVYFLMDFQHNSQHAEKLTVIPPDGYIAIPGEILVWENEEQIVHIYEWRGL